MLLSRGDDFAFVIPIKDFEIQLHVSVFLVLGAMLALNAVKQLDLNVYHRMLRGAVAFGEDFEANYMKKIFDLEHGMTQPITHFSQYIDASAKAGSDGKYAYKGRCKTTAHDKIKSFYKRTNIFLCFSAIVLLVASNISQLPSAKIEQKTQNEMSTVGDSQ